MYFFLMVNTLKINYLILKVFYNFDIINFVYFFVLFLIFIANLHLVLVNFLLDLLNSILINYKGNEYVFIITLLNRSNTRMLFGLKDLINITKDIY